ncbi:DUF397 domain-containing protein [Actinosynnema mirum]|uniref:DUF397 domain-containing protein n=1 Tax=Actinosynnema mirum (strain ATCC 29888 / DSM 43827 / JCM 3225 / NBRC 14064 / NCIMB 13271 / NRRL B-12336 / IMRU 3971 / 101) TaxID=446462 RepID=C6WG36_ACTMD|nr:DUF397 domain-containing protein [Actinosynnema mirum]ACU39800.1 protein of unknown function DUF397 [Actinosynnema mirum DSM 43827]
MNSEVRYTGSWRKSARSGSGAQCVELRCTSEAAREVRDSKAPQAGALSFDGAAWRKFLSTIQQG